MVIISCVFSGTKTALSWCQGISLFLFFFLTRILDLQCGVTFWCTVIDLVLHTYMYSFSYSLSLWVITGHWIQFPGLYSRTLWFICFLHSSLYPRIPNSLIQLLRQWFGRMPLGMPVRSLAFQSKDTVVNPNRQTRCREHPMTVPCCL